MKVVQRNCRIGEGVLFFFRWKRCEHFDMLQTAVEKDNSKGVGSKRGAEPRTVQVGCRSQGKL